MENLSEVIILAAVLPKPRSWQKADFSTLDLSLYMAFMLKLEENLFSIISVYWYCLQIIEEEFSSISTMRACSEAVSWILTAKFSFKDGFKIVSLVAEVVVMAAP